jgi:hypothetical protein
MCTIQCRSGIFFVSARTNKRHHHQRYFDTYGRYIWSTHTWKIYVYHVRHTVSQYLNWSHIPGFGSRVVASQFQLLQHTMNIHTVQIYIIPFSLFKHKQNGAAPLVLFHFSPKVFRNIHMSCALATRATLSFSLRSLPSAPSAQPE